MAVVRGERRSASASPARSFFLVRMWKDRWKREEWSEGSALNHSGAGDEERVSGRSETSPTCGCHLTAQLRVRYVNAAPSLCAAWFTRVTRHSKLHEYRLKIDQNNEDGCNLELLKKKFKKKSIFHNVLHTYFICNSSNLYAL